MSAGDRDTLAAILAEHLPVSLAPSKETGPDWLISGWSDLRAVADVLLASDWLREQRAQAKAAAVRDAIGIIEVVGGHDEPNIEKETAASWLERFAAEIVSEATEDTDL